MATVVEPFYLLLPWIQELQIDFVNDSTHNQKCRLGHTYSMFYVLPSWRTWKHYSSLDYITNANTTDESQSS